MIKRMKNIMQNPLAILIGIVLGVIIGLYVKPLVKYLSFFEKVYLNLFQVCVFPIIVCAVARNVGALLKLEAKKWLKVVVVTLIFSAAIGILSTFLLKSVVTPDEETKKALSSLTNDGAELSVGDSFPVLSYYSEEPIHAEAPTTFADFLFGMVPNNVFASLANGATVQVVLFCIILGFMIPIIKKEYSQPIVQALGGVHEALMGFINKIIFLIPVLICAILAEIFSDTTVLNSIKVFSGFLLLQYIATFLVIVGAFILIQIKVHGRMSVIEHVKAIKRIFIVSFSTSSCMSSLPVVIDESTKKFKLNHEQVKSMSSIGMVLCQPGTVASVSGLVCYATLIYNVPLTFNNILIILFGAIAFSLSVAGVPGVAAINSINIILNPLGMPIEVVKVLFLTTAVAYQNLNSFSSVYGSVATMIFSLDEESNKSEVLINT